MEDLLKGTIKFAVGTCITLGAVTVAGSVVAASTVGKVLSAGAKAAKEAMKEEMANIEEKKEAVGSADNSEMVAVSAES